MAKYDTLIKGGTVIDGTGMPRFVGDVAISAGVIERIGGNIDEGTAIKVVRAEGRIVAPGAIDAHSHFDVQVHWDPYCTPNSWHGMTTQVITNCGFGFAPVRPAARERTMRMMETTEQISYLASRRALSWDWESFPEWVDHMRRQPKGVNLALYFPTNPALAYVMGADEAKKRSPTAVEMAKLRDLLNEAMDAGAIGFSLSHLLDTSSHTDYDGSPMPSDVHDPETFYRLGEVLRGRDQGMIQALVDLPGVSTRFLAEELARSSRRRILHNVAGPYDGQPEYHREILAWLDKCEHEGLDVYSFSGGRPFLATQFTFEDQNLIESVPYFRPFSRASNEEKKRLSGDAEFLAGARNAYDPVIFTGNAIAFDSLLLIDAAGAERFRKYEGRRMADIAAAEGMDIVDAVFAIIEQSDVQAEFKSYMATDSKEGLREVWAHSRTLIAGTDGGAHVKLLASGDTTTEILTYIVRDWGFASAEYAHFKMSFLPARFFGFEKRGALIEGYAADLMIYDAANVGSTRSYEKIFDVPDGSFRRAVRAVGVEQVMVNGRVIFDGGECTGELPGRLVGNAGAQVDAALAMPDLLAAE